MFLKRNRRKVDGETYEYWSLMRTVRTAKGPRHRLVANLGKAPGLDSRTRRGWEEVVDMLDARAGNRRYRQMKLGESVEKNSTKLPLPQWTQVDVNGLRIECVRDFGEVYFVGTFSDVVNLARLMSYDFWVFFRIGVVKCAHFCRMLAIKKARFQSGLFRF